MLQLQDYQSEYEKEFSLNYNDSNEVYKRHHIVSLLDNLECTDAELRMKSCKYLVYITLGCSKADKGERFRNLTNNNDLLVQLDTFNVCYCNFRQLCDKLLEDRLVFKKKCFVYYMYTCRAIVVVIFDLYCYDQALRTGRRFTKKSNFTSRYYMFVWRFSVQILKMRTFEENLVRIK